MNAVENITLDWIHARVIDQDGCMVWNGACGKQGTIPQARIGGVAMTMRRVIWQLTHEREIQSDRRISPACGNPKCLHPDHLKARPVNAVFRGKKKTLVHRANIAKGKRASSRWDDETIRRVAASVGPLDQVAQELGMDRSYVSLIRRNKARIDFTNPYAQLMGAQ